MLQIFSTNNEHRNAVNNMSTATKLIVVIFWLCSEFFTFCLILWLFDYVNNCNCNWKY